MGWKGILVGDVEEMKHSLKSIVSKFQRQSYFQDLVLKFQVSK